MTAYEARAALGRAAMRLRLVGEPDRRSVRTAAAFAGAGWTIVMLLRLMLGGVVGMGDNGDAVRLLCPLGVVSNHPWDGQPSAHLYPTWVSHDWYGETCGAQGSGEQYYSSQQLVLALAKVLTPVLGLPGALDLRAAGALLAFAFGALIALLVVLLPGPLWLRLTVTAGFGLIMCDSAFAGFLISPFSEPSALIGLLLLCPALLLLWRRPDSSLGGIVLTTVAVIFTITAKPQLISLVPVAMLALLWLPSARRKDNRRKDKQPAPAANGKSQQRLGRWLAARWPALIACVVLCGVTAGFAATQPKRLNQLVWYDAVFVEMLPHSPDPVADLKALGADTRLISAMNSRMNDLNSAARTPYWDDYRQNVTPAKIVVHFLTNPGRLVGMGARGIQAVTRPGLEYLGSYPADSGHEPYAKERRIAVVSAVFDGFRSVPALVPLLWLGTIVLGAMLASRAWARHSARAVGRLTVCVVLALFLQFWSVVLTEGASDLVKHMIFTDFLTALCIPLAALCFWLLYRREHAMAPERPQAG
ncbi:glycan biosynthesis hexose transferase WsfD [Streptomyces shenzhenensis]